MFATLSPTRASFRAKPLNAVRLTNVGKRLDERPVLRDISLEIAAGEFLAVLGSNGAGKSTLLKLLIGMITPDEGNVELFGESLRTADPAIRRRVGYVGHQSMLYRDLSARQNIAFFAKLYGVDDVKGETDAILRTVGLLERGDDAVKTFSRGMTQRVSIARALVHNPDLLLADEPFAGLDARSSEGLEKLFTRMNAAGRTIIMVNHDVPQSLRIARRAIVLSNGKVESDRSTDNVDPELVLAEINGT